MGLQCVIVVFPDHTRILFELKYNGSQLILSTMLQINESRAKIW